VLEPQFRERVWGGQRLRPADPPVGEAWIVHDDSRVMGGPDDGRTLAELVRADAPGLLGRDVLARTGERFPLLIKLLDCADWLSVQVHPDDAQARRLVGPDEFGKTEAWYFLDTEPGATILAGVREGTDAGALEAAIRAGRVLDVAERQTVEAGDTVFIAAGTLHALGPGMLLYEVQQSSDTTYRVYDWDRPASAGRALHLDESVAVTDPEGRAVRATTPRPDHSGAQTAVRCPYFELEVIDLVDSALPGDTAGRSFHVLTVTEGTVAVTHAQGEVNVETQGTVLIPARAGAYDLRPVGGAARVLRSSVPSSTDAAS
jgi:mannose-6-phosphate isomerase